MTNNDEFIDEKIPADDALKRIAELGESFLRYRNQVEMLKNQLETAEKEFNNIGNFLLPDAMKEIGLRSFTLKNGTKLEARPILGCSLPKANMDRAEKWLAENGHGGMVKLKLDVELPKNITYNELKALEEFMLEFQYKYELSKRIHPQTLLKWAREMEEENEIIPTEIFTVFHGFKTEIK